MSIADDVIREAKSMLARKVWPSSARIAERLDKPRYLIERARREALRTGTWPAPRHRSGPRRFAALLESELAAEPVWRTNRKRFVPDPWETEAIYREIPEDES